MILGLSAYILTIAIQRLALAPLNAEYVFFGGDAWHSLSCTVCTNTQTIVVRLCILGCRFGQAAERREVRQLLTVGFGQAENRDF